MPPTHQVSVLFPLVSTVVLNEGPPAFVQEVCGRLIVVYSGQPSLASILKRRLTAHERLKASHEGCLGQILSSQKLSADRRDITLTGTKGAILRTGRSGTMSWRIHSS